MSPDLPRNCADHRSNGHTEDKVYTIFTNTAPTTARDIYCYTSADPTAVRTSTAEFSLCFTHFVVAISHQNQPHLYKV